MLEIIQLVMFLARYKSLQGFNVFIQWVGILLVCQQKMLLRQNNLDPKTWTETNISNMKSQLKKLGFQLIGIEKFQHVHLNIININKNFF